MIPISVFHKKGTNSVKGTLSELNSANTYMYIKHALDGTKEAVYHVNFISLLDKVFAYNALRYLSIEQERFISKFFKQADIATNLLNEGYVDFTKEMDDVFKQLDNFLGSYIGENNGRFAK